MDSSSEENLFIDLSSVEGPGDMIEPGYYGFFADHSPSNSVPLSDISRKLSVERWLITEKLVSIENYENLSNESYVPKLIGYYESKIDDDKIESNNQKGKIIFNCILFQF